MKKTSFYRISHVSKFFGMALLAMSISFTACDKKEEEEEITPTTPPPAAPENPVPEFADGKGTMTAVQSRTFQNAGPIGTIPIDFGLAVAAYYSDPTATSFLDAGDVTCNGSDLKQQANNSYVFTPGPLDQSGIDFSSGTVDWDVTGSADIPTFTRTVYMGFPSVDEMISAKTIDRSKDYTLESNNITGADSIIFMVGGIYHVVSGGLDSHTFTAAELSTLGAGPNFAQITAYSWTSYNEGGEKFYYVNETVVTESVTIQ